MLRVTAGIVGGASLVLFLAAVWLTIGSRFGPPERDMHGYGLIVGTALSIPAGLLASAVLPLAFRGRRRTIAYRVGAAVVLLWVVVVLVSALTA